MDIWEVLERPNGYKQVLYHSKTKGQVLCGELEPVYSRSEIAAWIFDCACDWDVMLIDNKAAYIMKRSKAKA